MCIQGASGQPRPPRGARQSGGSTPRRSAPEASSLAPASTPCPHPEEDGVGLKPSSSVARSAQPSRALLATPDPAGTRPDLRAPAPAQPDGESAPQALDHRQVTRRLMTPHSPLQKEPNLGKTKKQSQTGETREKAVLLGTCLAASSFTSKQVLSKIFPYSLKMLWIIQDRSYTPYSPLTTFE